MKKLSVLLLATVFVFGLVVQAGAQEQGPHVVSKDAFDGDPVITFDEFAAPYDPATHPDGYDCWVDPQIPPALIGMQYMSEFGVSFSGLLYGENSWAPIFFTKFAASNFNVCEFYNEIGTAGAPITVKFDPPVTRVGFLGLSPYGEITVTPFRDGVATGYLPPVSAPFYEQTFIGIEDSDGIDEIKIEGSGQLGKVSIFWIDDLTFGRPTDIQVKVNIKPPNCLEARIPFNVKSKGVTPVVIIGGGSYDVSEIDPATVRLQGVEPVHYAIENASHCGAEKGDGELDLTLKFDTKTLVDAIKNSLDEGDTLEDGEPVFLNLTGNLFDGTPIRDDGGLFVTIIVKEKHEHENRGRGNMHPLHDRGHHKGWDKNR